MGEALPIVGAGLGTGLVGALVVARLARRLLVGVSPTDPLVFFAATGLLGAVAVLAVYLPARRGGRVDPLLALRAE